MLSLNIKGYARFYTRQVNTHVNTLILRGLYRTAGLVRTTARRAMRLRAGASRPGSPPHAHTRGGLRQIDFVVDRHEMAAIVGPVKFVGSNFFNEPVPYIHEFGGQFFASSRIWSYPERSYMYYTIRKLASLGKIPPQFSVSIARVL